MVYAVDEDMEPGCWSLLLDAVRPGGYIIICCREEKTKCNIAALSGEETRGEIILLSANNLFANNFLIPNGIYEDLLRRLGEEKLDRFVVARRQPPDIQV